MRRVTLDDLTGCRFGALTVIERAANIGRQTAWRCRCDCGVVREAISAIQLTHGGTRSCGCYRVKVATRRKLKHGQSARGAVPATAEYQTWKHLKQRCYKTTSKDYKYYGGRGIRVCDRWLTDFSAFVDDMGCRPSDKYSIDRIDNDGDYEPANCRWATRKQQRLNQRPRIKTGVLQ